MQNDLRQRHGPVKQVTLHERAAVRCQVMRRFLQRDSFCHHAQAKVAGRG